MKREKHQRVTERFTVYCALCGAVVDFRQARYSPAAGFVCDDCRELGGALRTRTGSARGDALYDYIADYIAARGVAPMHSEMMAGLGIASRAALQKLLRGLEARGLITRKMGRRGIRLTENCHE